MVCAQRQTTCRRQSAEPGALQEQTIAPTGLISLNDKATKKYLAARGLFGWYLKSTYQTASNLEIHQKSLKWESNNTRYLHSHIA